MLFLFLVCALLIPLGASAHEAYLLPRDYFWSDLHSRGMGGVFDALKNPQDLSITIKIVVAVFILLFLNFLFRRTRVGQKLNTAVEKLSFLGPIFVRVAVAVSLFLSARSSVFLGPELPLALMPSAHIMQILLYASSFMIFFGFFTEIGAAISLAIFTLGFVSFGGYMITYLNYLGELTVLLLFGMRQWSVDKYILGPLKRLPKFSEYKTSIVRICYGLGLLYAAITVKLLHPELTLKIVNDWNLTQFHWLFPSDPHLVVLGAGVVEAVIGIFIIVGFELRMTVLISLFYITLSLFYFRELVWPHILLYGISLNLLVEPEFFTLDHLLLRGKT